MYQNTAQGLASLGRNNDSMLVHMTPGEVGGLQQLAQVHGGSLSINPQTGLVEAGFLSSILPMLAGAAAVGLSGGTAAPFLAEMGLSSGMMGALAGGATGAMFGDPKRGLLMNAGMGALGGYGGGNLYSGLSTAGMNAAQTGALQASDSAIAAQLAQAQVPTIPPEFLSGPATSTSFFPENYYDFPTSQEVINKGVTSSINEPQTYFDASTGVIKQAPFAPPSLATAQEYGAFGRIGAPAPASSIKDINLTKFAKDNIGPLAAVGLPALMGAGFFKPNTLNTAGNQPKPAQYYNTTFNPTKFNPATGKYEAASYGPGSYGPTARLATGGLMDKADAMFPDDSAKTPDVSGLSNAQISLLAEEADDPFTQAAAVKERDRREITQRSPKSAYTKYAAQGGLMDLSNEYAAGGTLLQGPGDGMSDSIPAVIKGPKPQRAALAQGEFVIPADVVSHLGNGSTDAGAKRLYSMMDKIRHARTGNKKQGRQINPDKFMPA